MQRSASRLLTVSLVMVASTTSVQSTIQPRPASLVIENSAHGDFLSLADGTAVVSQRGLLTLHLKWGVTASLPSGLRACTDDPALGVSALDRRGRFTLLAHGFMASRANVWVSASGTCKDTAGKLAKHTLHAEGSVKWAFVTGSRVDSSPAISATGTETGTVYIGSGDTNVYALTSGTGQPRWKYKTGGYVLSSPAIGTDGTVYVGSLDTSVYALRLDGTLSSTLAIE